MTALGCVLFGMEGKFRLPGGLNFTYTRETQSDYFKGKAFSTPLAWALNSRPLQIVALGYLHVTIHELGHALLARAYGATTVDIRVSTSSCEGMTSPNPSGLQTSFLHELGGPLAGMLFRIGLIALSTLLTGTVPAVILTALKVMSLAWMTGEMAYLIAGSTIGGGDWKSIAHDGLLPWSISTTTMTTIYIAGIVLAL